MTWIMPKQLSSVRSLISLIALLVIVLAHPLAPAGAQTPEPAINDCPVTPYAAVVDPVFTGTWYGDDRFAAGLDPAHDGQWFTEVKVGWRLPTGTTGEELSVTGTRIDGAPGSLNATVPAGYQSWFQASGLRFTSPGCWRVTASIGNDILSFVIWVHKVPAQPSQPIPDKAEQFALAEPLREISVSGCAGTTPIAPISRISEDVYRSSPIFIANLHSSPDGRSFFPIWITSPDYQGPILIRGQGMDGQGEVTFGNGAIKQAWLYRGWRTPGSEPDWRLWGTTMQIPAPGCYAFQVDGEGFSVTFIVAL